MTASLDWLRTLTLVLTSRCNLRCAYCYQDRKQDRRMSLEVLDQAVDLLLASRRHELELWFTGGEPLLEPELLRHAIERVERTCPPGRHVRFGLMTNGLGLDVTTEKLVVGRRFDVQLSFDGLAAAQDLRAPGSFARLDRTLDRLRAHDPGWYESHVEVALTVTGATIHTLAESVAYLLGKRCGAIRLAPHAGVDADWAAASSARLRRQLDAVVELSLAHREATRRVPVALLRSRRPAGTARRVGQPRTKAPRRLCGLGQEDALVVDVDGRLAGCTMLAESYQAAGSPLRRRCVEALRLGPLGSRQLAERVAGFADAVARQRLFSLQGKHSRARRCSRCRYRAECAYCPLSIARAPDSDDPDLVPSHLCSWNCAAGAARARFAAGSG